MEQLESVVLTKQKRIAEIVKDHKGESLKALAHNINLEWLYVDYKRTRRDGAPGIDGVITRILGKWLKAGVFEDGNVKRSKVGTPQGGVISPQLSNLFLHVVFG